MRSLQLFDRGSGEPVVLVPGIQGRWEWMRPCAEGLAEEGRVLATSLPGEPGSGFQLKPEGGFDVHVDQIDAILDRAGIASTVLCGVSFGGWVAVRYAALRPERVKALILASAPGPAFKPDTRQQYYIRAPRLLLPVFAYTSRQRLRPEVFLSFPDPRERRAFMRSRLGVIARYPVSPSLMARRISLALGQDFEADARSISVPTLVMTGEQGFDRVVPVTSTQQYLSVVPGARGVVLEKTGHLGCVTRPREFARLVRGFASGALMELLEGRGASAQGPAAR
jgi:pimeloyl-ACP methyl ester carboxylesterase